MELNDAVKKARKELGLSQQKLAEMAGIQRRQLATLESGGNVTLATIRKVIAQLPNLGSFAVDAVRISPGRTPRTLSDSIVTLALATYSAVLTKIGNNLLNGIDPGPEEVSMLEAAHQGMMHAIKSQHWARVIEAEEAAAAANGETPTAEDGA